MEEKKYTIKRVKEDGTTELVKRDMPRNHLKIIEDQMKAQAKIKRDQYIEEKKKEKRRKANKNARKARKKR